MNVRNSFILFHKINIKVSIDINFVNGKTFITHTRI